jgi:hypothetical protein
VQAFVTLRDQTEAAVLLEKEWADAFAPFVFKIARGAA